MSERNLLELQEFRSQWKHHDKGNVVKTGRFIVSASINYMSPRFLGNDISEVSISFDGYEAGNIEISPTPILNNDECHLGFKDLPSIDYVFDEDSNTLVIEGASQKLGGEYAVRIHPVK